MTIQDSLRAFAAACEVSAPGQDNNLTVTHIVDVAAFIHQHLDDLLALTYTRCTICNEPVLSGESEHAECLNKTVRRCETCDATLQAGETNFCHVCDQFFNHVNAEYVAKHGALPESESIDKQTTDADPALQWIKEHTTVRHLTPPSALDPVETIQPTAPRCGCGNEADYYRAGKHWCSECLIEQGDLD